MKQIYGDLSMLNGAHEAGICSLQIVPKEWIQTFPDAAHATGSITTAITLKAGYAWLNLNLNPDTATFTEKPKQVKGLPFFDVNISGALNDLTAAQRQQIETIRYHELVCIYKDAKGRKRVTGNRETGLIASFDFINTNKSDGLLEVGVELGMQQAQLSPYYTA